MGKKSLHAPYAVTRRKPKGDKKYLDFFKSEYFYNHTSKSYLYKLNSCYVTHYGPVLNGITFVPVLTSQMLEKPIFLAKLYLSCIKKIILNKVTPINTKCIVVHNNYMNNYYHWVLEIFFRLYLVKDYLTDHTLVMPKISFGYQQEMLKLLNVEPEQIINIYPENLIKAKEVIIPQYLASYGNYEPVLLREYAAWILSKVTKQSVSQPDNRKVYITRNNAAYRKISNEESLIQKLNDLDFFAISLENLTFPEQVQLFNEASVIVAPHGAGLTNLIYCQPQTKVIELLPAGYIHLCFYTLADVFDLDYYYLIGKDIKNNPTLKPYQYDTEIEISALENLLNQEVLTD